jgi:hypothetical protein
MLCTLTAAALAVLSVGVMVTRYFAAGAEAPAGPNTWKVTLAVRGASQGGDARVTTAAPLDFGRQHVLREQFSGEAMRARPAGEKQPDRRQMVWVQQGGAADGPFKLRCEYSVSLEVLHPSSRMARLAKGLYAAPKPGEYLSGEAKGDGNDKVVAKARHLTGGIAAKADAARVLYEFVEKEIANAPSVGGPSAAAAECLKSESGDSAAKARLLAALLRSRDIPARLVCGVTLSRGAEQRAHYWVEAWLDRWLPMCPATKHYGHVPGTFLVLAYGDQPVVKGNKHVKDLEYGFLIERASAQDLGQAEASPLRRFFLAASFYHLPPPEQRLVEILLLLPVAALIICIYRNLIGLNSFGTFAPALVGLAFRELHTLPGILVFVSILLVGWVMRRVLDHYHLLQVPRIALMLSLIVAVLIAAVAAANCHDLPATKYFSLFPMIILTGMVERFWTLETEDSTAASFKTLLCTMFIAGTIALVLSLSHVGQFLFRHPEALGLIMACQLLIGRYTGFRLMELFRFRDFTTTPPAGGPSPQELGVVR